MKLSKLILISPVLCWLGACTDDSNYNFAVPSVALFNGVTQTFPFPNNLAFGADGTLNLPLDAGVDENDTRNAIVAVNTLDGFSTIEPITSTFSHALDPASLVIGDSVRVFETEVEPTGIVTGVVGELNAADVFASAPGEGTTLVISPLKPLKENTHYMFIVTSGVSNTAGMPSSASQQFQQVTGSAEIPAALEPLRQLTRPLIGLAEAQGVAPDTIILAWTVKTQSITPALTAIQGGLVPAIVRIDAPSIDSLNRATVYTGTIDLPYYRTAPADENDPVGVNSFWTGANGSFLTAFNPNPVATRTLQAPLLVSIPNASSERPMPATGWPVALFVHGIRSNRKGMFGLANRMAVEGVAVIAIDQPMHGITDTADPLYRAGQERTFDLDLANNETDAPGGDGIIDSSGAHYFSPAFLLASRDNLRQATADLMVLSASIDNIAIGESRLDVNRKSVIGHSLGGTVSTAFLAFDTSIQAATLAMPAAGLARTLIESPAFGPSLLEGLEAVANIQPNSPELDRFLVAAQTIIDSGDSINYAARAAANAPIHMIEVVGDGVDNPADQVVPNSVPRAPLSGTEPLARLMGLLPPVGMTTDGPGLVQFTAGGHETLLTAAGRTPEEPTNDTAFNEMQQQTAIFASTSGTQLRIENTSIIRQPETQP